MGKRFGRYAFALKAIKVGTGDTPATADAGSPLGKYQKWRKGDIKLEYPRAEESKQKAIMPVAVRPFTLPNSDDNLFRVGISKRTFDEGDADGVQAKCNLVVDVDLVPPNKIRGFLPARVTVRKKATGDGEAAESKITGVKYQKLTASSWTLPYGQKDAVSTESEVREEIFEVVKASETLKVTFTSERL